MHGRVVGIFTSPALGASVVPHHQVRATPGVGLDGDRYALGTGFWSGDNRVSRDLTLVESEVADALEAELGEAVGAASLRRNVVTRGVALDDLIGRRFRVGEVVAEGTSRCEPCVHLQELVGRPILRPLVHRSGLRANVLTPGVIRVGDAIEPSTAPVGVGVVVRRGRRVLLGLRRGVRGNGTWSTPGGSVDPAEGVLACAVRELYEETGLHGLRPRVVATSTDRLEDGQAWRSVFVAVDVAAGREPVLREPDRHASWGWFDADALPRPVFAPVTAVLG